MRAGPSVILSRAVRDTSGKVAGLVGAVLRVEDLGRLIGRSWFGPGISIELHGVDGVLALPVRDPPPSQQQAEQGDAGWGMNLMSTVNRLLGIPPELSVSAPLRTVDATVVARMDADVALKSHGLSTRAVGILGAYLFAVWVTCMALAVSSRLRSEAPGSAPIGYGATFKVAAVRDPGRATG